MKSEFGILENCKEFLGIPELQGIGNLKELRGIAKDCKESGISRNYEELQRIARHSREFQELGISRNYKELQRVLEFLKLQGIPGNCKELGISRNYEELQRIARNRESQGINFLRFQSISESAAKS